jgi:hypothetical protein
MVVPPLSYETPQATFCLNRYKIALSTLRTEEKTQIPFILFIYKCNIHLFMDFWNCEIQEELIYLQK